LTLLRAGNAFVLLNHNNVATKLELQINDDNNDNSVFCEREETSRRGFLGAAVGLGVSTTSVMLSFSPPAFAAPSQEEIDKANVVKGYKRLQFLLDNWDKETTVCGMGGDKLERSCDRTPMKVMEYMGYRSTTDPLYKGEKTLRRLYDIAPAKRDGEYVEAVETFAENADEASGMAFISSWGEANPGESNVLFSARSFFWWLLRTIIHTHNSLLYYSVHFIYLLQVAERTEWSSSSSVQRKMSWPLEIV
jgi:hypothetical protein